MEKLTIKQVKCISVLATRKMFNMLFRDIQQGRDIEKTYGLNPYEINLIFHVTKTPYGVPELEYEAEEEIKSSFEKNNYPHLSYMANKGNFLAFISKAIDHLHNQYPDTQPKLWQMDYTICQNMKLKITRYQIETIKAAGFNPAAVLIYCGLIQQCNSTQNNSFNLTNHDRTIGVTLR